MKKLFIIIILAMVLLLSGCKIKEWFVPAGNVSYVTFEEIPVEEGTIAPDVNETIHKIEKEELSGMPVTRATEGELVRLDSITSRFKDPEGDILAFTYSAPFSPRGEWQTKAGDAGEKTVKITASDGVNKVSVDIKVIIEPSNKAPVLEKIKDVVASEGETVSFDPKALDPEGEPVTITYSGWMSTSSYKTSYNDAGEHSVTIKVSDGVYETKQDVKVTVKNVNRPPVLEQLNDVTVKEGDIASLEAKASDPDGDDVSISFSEPLDEDGEWKTKVGDAGEYTITVTATDGSLESKQTVKIIVQALNKAPVFEEIKDIVVDEGETVQINAVASDPEGKQVTIKYAGWMTSDSYKTNYNDAGVYKVTVTVSDGVSEASQDVKITVNDVNRPPVFE